MSEPREHRPFEELADELDPRELEELAARLAVASDAVEPSPAVRERVMTRIDRAAALRSERPARRWQVPASLAAAAALGALLTWGAIGGLRGPGDGGPGIAEQAAPADEAQRLADQREEHEKLLASQREELEEQLAEQDEELAGLERELREARDALSVLTAQNLERLDLAPAKGSPSDAEARVYWDWDEYSCYFVADGLPATGDEDRYALWLYTDQGEVLLAGRFAASGREPASFYAMLPKDMGKVVRAVVTEEPAAGEPSQTPGEPVEPVEPVEPTGRVLLTGGATT